MPFDPASIEPTKVYRTDEAAKLIGKTGGTFAKAMKRREIRPLRSDARPHLWQGADILALLGLVPVARTAADVRRVKADAVKRIQGVRGK